TPSAAAGAGRGGRAIGSRARSAASGPRGGPPEKREARGFPRASHIPGNDLLSRLLQYHRRTGLNGRVRNGNGGDPGAMVNQKFFNWRVRQQSAVRSLSEAPRPDI